MAIKAKNMNTPPTMETNINADCAADNELFLLSVCKKKKLKCKK